MLIDKLLYLRLNLLGTLLERGQSLCQFAGSVGRSFDLLRLDALCTLVTDGDEVVMRASGIDDDGVVLLLPVLLVLSCGDDVKAYRVTRLLELL